MSFSIRLARPAEAAQLAGLSRDLIEYDLPWRWSAERVLRCLKDRATNGIVAVAGGRVLGFALMHYLDAEAHLLLLAVTPTARRAGVGRALVAWLEDTARVAGVGTIRLEVRAANEGARAFYRRLGYREGQLLPGYYEGREAALRLSRRLWSPATEAASQVAALLLNWRPST